MPANTETRTPGPHTSKVQGGVRDDEAIDLEGPLKRRQEGNVRAGYGCTELGGDIPYRVRHVGANRSGPAEL